MNIKNGILTFLIGILIVSCSPASTVEEPIPPSEEEIEPTSQPKIVNLSVQVSPEGSGRVTVEEGSYKEGEKVEIFAEPFLGYAFENWSGDESYLTPGISVDMDADKRLTANFVKVPTLVEFFDSVDDLPVSHRGNALIDFDSDGDQDLMLTFFGHWNLPKQVYALRNEGDGSFTNASQEVFAGQVIEASHMTDWAVEDFNNDGYVDLFMADIGLNSDQTSGGQSRIFMQTESGQLIDDTENRLPIQDMYTQSITTGDIDGDGDIDIYIANTSHKIGPRFYINDGNGIFSEDNSHLPKDVQIRINEFMSSKLVDVDNDDDLDLVLGNLTARMTDMLLLNDGKGAFTLAPSNSLPAHLGGATTQTFDIRAADFNQDGWQDLVMAVSTRDGYFAKLQLLYNNGDGTFTDETARMEQEFGTYSQNECSLSNVYGYINRIFIFDGNNDGFPDILSQGTDCVESVLFQNWNGEEFKVTENYSQYSPWSKPYAVLPGDINGDEIRDVFLLYNQVHQYLQRIDPSDPNSERKPEQWTLINYEEVVEEPTESIECIDQSSIKELNPEAEKVLLYRDDFDSILAPGWEWVREDKDLWNLAEREGYLQLILEPAAQPRNILLRQAPEGDFEISTYVEFEPESNFQFAGLVIYQDNENMVNLGRAFCYIDVRPDLCVGNGIYFNGVASSTCPNSKLNTESINKAYLKIRREGSIFSAYVSSDGIEWTMFGQHMAPIDDMRVGLITLGTDVRIIADFDYFLIETLE